MRSIVRLLLVVVLAVVFLPGCAVIGLFIPKKPQKKQEESKAMVQIGSITLINPEASFVLIDNGYRMAPVMGDMLESRAPDGSTAQLRVTDIRKRPFVIADIVNGIPGKGDLVFQQKKAEKPMSTPLPQ